MLYRFQSPQNLDLPSFVFHVCFLRVLPFPYEYDLGSCRVGHRGTGCGVNQRPLPQGIPTLLSQVTSRQHVYAPIFVHISDYFLGMDFQENYQEKEEKWT